MWIVVMVFVALAVAGVVASVVVVLRDGYRAEPTRVADTPYENEGDRNRFGAEQRFGTR